MIRPRTLRRHCLTLQIGPSLCASNHFAMAQQTCCLQKHMLLKCAQRLTCIDATCKTHLEVSVKTVAWLGHIGKHYTGWKCQYDCRYHYYQYYYHYYYCCCCCCYYYYYCHYPYSWCYYCCYQYYYQLTSVMMIVVVLIIVIIVVVIVTLRSPCACSSSFSLAMRLSASALA